MIAYWLPFLIGATTGSIMSWVVPALTTRLSPHPAEERTVAAIAARLERERLTGREARPMRSTAVPARTHPRHARLATAH
ncbi:Uncharacterised protein [Nocardia otitidiscaviarum]|uniref:Uncharacterized protein n=1 Tax=Nocardia otitidiscaviarum TaxID=1823 RepID=A0A379JGN3_9NOCA|nr:hypothetical protein [Nocardia otitidiscaviarum]MBF6177290.1 hypothetical protein [Nocardia otitidiscaviarum]SUD47431.1 Uncharacterised protein [Nocardia otitidiscaviarum]